MAKLSKNESLERDYGDYLNAQYWWERLLEYRCAFTDLSTMVNVLMAYEPQFRCAQARDRVKRALKRPTNATFIRLIVETIRRHLKASPTQEKVYKALRRMGITDFTGMPPRHDPNELSLEDLALLERLKRPTRRVIPSREPA